VFAINDIRISRNSNKYDWANKDWFNLLVIKFDSFIFDDKLLLFFLLLDNDCY